MPYTLPNPADRPAPKDDDGYPYSRFAQEGAKPKMPTSVRTPYTDARFPKVLIKFKHLIGGLDSVQRETLKAKGDQYLAIVPLGAGPGFVKLVPDARDKILDFIRGIAFDEDMSSDAGTTQAAAANADSLSLVQPSYNGRARAFDKPWTFILEGASQDLRNFLLWQQTFAVSTTIVFHVLPFIQSEKSWVIATYSGEGISPRPEMIKLALENLKLVIWGNVKLRNLVKDVATKRGIQGHAQEMLVDVTDTWRLEYVDCLSGDKPDPFWQLTGKPFADSDEDHATYLKLVRATRFHIGLQAIHGTARKLGCNWCASEMHPSYRCSFPTIDDAWLGPTKEQLAERLKRVTDADSSNPPGRVDVDNRSQRTINRDERNFGWEIARGRGRGHGRGRGRGRGGFKPDMRHPRLYRN